MLALSTVCSYVNFLARVCLVIQLLTRASDVPLKATAYILSILLLLPHYKDVCKVSKRAYEWFGQDFRML
jgi:hypothetical protein